MIKVFFLEQTGKQSVSLRRYRSSSIECNKSGFGYCNAHTPLPDDLSSEPSRSFSNAEDARKQSEQWPTHCACGYEFLDTDNWMVFRRPLYRRDDTGEEMTLHDAPVGACWNAPWMIRLRKNGEYVGPDGRCLVVKTPGGEWMLDSFSSNCTKKDNPGNHKCWVRHGRPEDPHTFTVDKNGDTCGAGAGSIVCGSYHGFLRNGMLVPC